MLSVHPPVLAAVVDWKCHLSHLILQIPGCPHSMHREHSEGQWRMLQVFLLAADCASAEREKLKGVADDCVHLDSCPGSEPSDGKSPHISVNNLCRG